MSGALRSPLAPALVSSWSAAAKGKARASAYNLASTSQALPSTPSSSSSSRRGIAASSVADPSTPSPPSSHQANPTAPTFSSPLGDTPISSTSAALALLKEQPNHYIVTSLVGRTLLLTTRDVFTIPRLRDVQVGDVLELDRIHEVGSRDYTLRAQDPMSTRQRGMVAEMRRSVDQGENSKIVRALLELGEEKEDGPLEGGMEGAAAEELQAIEALSKLKTSTDSWATRLHPSGLAHVGAVLPETTVRARCVVVEHTKGAMERIVKKKRRKGYKKTIEHKQTYTRLRLESIRLGDGELAQ